MPIKKGSDMPSAVLQGLNSAPTFAVIDAGERIALSSLEENARYAAQVVQHAQVVECVLVPGTITPAGIQFWGYFRNPCIHESAPALVSLHPSKASAWRAKHRADYQAWEEAQREGRARSKDVPLCGKDRYWRRPDPFERSSIGPVPLKD